jgi:hypothetical protein
VILDQESVYASSKPGAIANFRQECHRSVSTTTYAQLARFIAADDGI